MSEDPARPPVAPAAPGANDPPDRPGANAPEAPDAPAANNAPEAPDAPAANDAPEAPDTRDAPPVSSPDWARPHLRPGERVLWWGRPSKLGLVSNAVFTVGGLALFFAGFTFESRGAVGLFSVPGVLAVFGAGSRLVRQVVQVSFTAYLVTNQRFYSVTSFLASTVQSLPLARITTVRLRQGLVEHAFGLWTAEVSAYGEAGAKLEIPAMRDGDGLLAHTRDGMERGASAAWILSGD